MIESILPTAAAAAEVFEDPPGLLLYPEEAAFVARAVAGGLVDALDEGSR